jgi:arsenical pump membrane protein
MPHAAHLQLTLTWVIAALATLGVLARPLRTPEALWAVAGAGLMVLLGLISPARAWTGIAKGTDVYLFLAGMMLLSEIARLQGLFDWVAAYAVNHAKGSPRRLFGLVYLVGVATTAVLSNDATAVVLTPAVFAAARKAGADPLPHLFVCALVANAASFLLPISNPANLVLYASRTPPLGPWLASFLLPSLLAIGATFIALRFVERRRLQSPCAQRVAQPPLTRGGRTALIALGLTAVVLIAASAVGMPLGAPTAAMGVLTAAVVLVRERTAPWPVLKGVAWSVLVLVAGLFVMVEALDQSGLVALLGRLLQQALAQGAQRAAAISGAVLAVVCNLMNNLPAGLIASSVLKTAQAPKAVTDALLIGVDLGPNLSITGSLATLLWLRVIRREGEDVDFWRFLKVGTVVMPPALALALGARLLLG